MLVLVGGAGRVDGSRAVPLLLLLLLAVEERLDAVYLVM